MNLLNRDTGKLECVCRMDHTPPFFFRSTISVSEVLIASEWKAVYCGEDPTGRGKKNMQQILISSFLDFRASAFVCQLMKVPEFGEFEI